MGPSFLTAFAWRYTLANAILWTWFPVFSKKEFFIPDFFTGGDVVVKVDSYSTFNFAYFMIFSHCTTAYSIENIVVHVQSCIFDCLLHDSILYAELCMPSCLTERKHLVTRGPKEEHIQ